MIWKHSLYVLIVCATNRDNEAPSDDSGSRPALPAPVNGSSNSSNGSVQAPPSFSTFHLSPSGGQDFQLHDLGMEMFPSSSWGDESGSGEGAGGETACGESVASGDGSSRGSRGGNNGGGDGNNNLSASPAALRRGASPSGGQVSGPQSFVYGGEDSGGGGSTQKLRNLLTQGLEEEAGLGGGSDAPSSSRDGEGSSSRSGNVILRELLNQEDEDGMDVGGAESGRKSVGDPVATGGVGGSAIGGNNMLRRVS